MKRRRINKPRFNLKDPSAVISDIHLVFTFPNGKRFKYSSGKKVKVKYWNKSERLAKETLKYPESKALNIYLRNLLNQFEDVIKARPNIGFHELKKTLDRFNGISVSDHLSQMTLIDYADEYIRKSKLHFRTIQKFRTTRNHLLDYSDSRDIRLTFDKINIDWKNDFVNFLTTRAEKDGKKKGRAIQSANTLNKILATVKRFMNAASEERRVIDGELKPLHTNMDFRKTDFMVSRVKSSKHYLQEGELIALAKLDLTESPSKDIVRDYFLLMCYTGLRWSDVIRLQKDHVADSTIHIHTYKGRTTKADNEVVIPLLDEARSILEKYDYKLPKPLTEQKHGSYIKKICEEAGVTRIVNHNESQVNELVETQVPIFTKVSNHTGRYTFINLMFEKYELSPLALSKITGQSIQVLMGYERGDKTKNAKNVLAKINSKKLRIAN